MTNRKRGRDAVGVELHEEKEGEAQKKKSSSSTGVSKRWTSEQDEALKKAVAELGHRNWMAVAERVPGRDNAQCLQRWNKVLKPGLVKGPWSVEEDARLMEMMLKGYDNWRQVSNNILGRTAKQCRERWRNRLDPTINKAPFTKDEDVAIQQAYEKYGNRWTQIAELLPGRTEDAVKLRWKALNPNQKTYTKLGRPRLLNTDDTPSVSTSPARPVMPCAQQTEVEVMKPLLLINNNEANTATEVTVEPIVDVLEDDTNERMSREDLMILNEFLRSHSHNSLESISMKNMSTSLRDIGDEVDAAMRVPSQSVAHSLLPQLETKEPAVSSVLSPQDSPSKRLLNKMLSLGETKSASLRSITTGVEPDDSWINGGLIRRLSSLSVHDEGIFEDHLFDSNMKLSSMDSFEQQLSSLSDVGSLMSLALDMGDESKTDRVVAAAGYDAVNEAGSLGDTSGSNGSLQQLILEHEIPVHGLFSQEAANTTDTKTVTAQEFYSRTVSHDQLSSAKRFEI